MQIELFSLVNDFTHSMILLVLRLLVKALSIEPIFKLFFEILIKRFRQSFGLLFVRHLDQPFSLTSTSNELQDDRLEVIVNIRTLSFH